MRAVEYKVTDIKVAEPDLIKEEIRIALETINGAWLSRNVSAIRLALSSCFHPEMVIKDAKLKTVASGREACVQSYVDFIQQARVSAYQQTEPEIHVLIDAAVASYNWEIAYSLDQKNHRERGGDIFVFVRAEEKWMAVWRAVLG